MTRRGYTVREVADMYGWEPFQVRRLIRQRRLGASRPLGERAYRITERHLAEFEAQGRAA